MYNLYIFGVTCTLFKLLHILYSCPLTDVNECEVQPVICDPQREFCLNTEGSFDCKCRLGYVLSDAGSCIGKFADRYVLVIWYCVYNIY